MVARLPWSLGQAGVRFIKHLVNEEMFSSEGKVKRGLDRTASTEKGGDRLPARRQGGPLINRKQRDAEVRFSRSSPNVDDSSEYPGSASLEFWRISRGTDPVTDIPLVGRESRLDSWDGSRLGGGDGSRKTYGVAAPRSDRSRRRERRRPPLIFVRTMRQPGAAETCTDGNRDEGPLRKPPHRRSSSRKTDGTAFKRPTTRRYERAIHLCRRRCRRRPVLVQGGPPDSAREFAQ